MAGGRGVRLKPLTDTTPKPLLLVAGAPLITYLITSLVKANLKDITITTHYKPESFRDILGDGLTYGANFLYHEEPLPLGTAGCLPRLARQFPNAHTFIVANADILADIPWHGLLDHHHSTNSDATFCTVTHNTQIEYGVVASNGEVVEKPTISLPILAGIYVLNTQYLRDLAPNKVLQMPDLLNSMKEEKLLITSYQLPGMWLDVGRQSSLENAPATLQAILEKP